MAIATLTLLTTLTARDAQATARNRIALDRARWLASGCAAIALSRAREVVERPAPGAKAPWDVLDAALGSVLQRELLPCAVTVRPTGVRLDVNHASDEAMHAFFGAAGVSLTGSDSLTDAVLDWIDADADARPLGAERDWYAAHAEATPRNGPFASVTELRRVRGISELPEAVRALLGVDSARIDLDRAAAPVLAALPGMTPGLLDDVLRARSEGRELSLETLAQQASPSDRAALYARFSDAAQLVTSSPDAWIIDCVAGDTSGVHLTESLRLVLANGRPIVAERSVW